MENSSGKKRLFLVDGSALIYKAYYAFIRNPLINSKGENISVVFGFARMLFSILDKEKPDYFAVVFDTPEPTFRHKLYEEYKAQRPAMPEDMVDQLPRIEQMLKALKIPLLRLPGYEADDLMGTLAQRATKEGMETVLVTGDKDLLQLVNSGVVVYNPKKAGEESEWLDAKAVREKLGIPPEKIPDYLALIGDSSDNIPGVPGIGPKGAEKLLQQFGSLEEILANLDRIGNKRYQKSLQENADLARLSKQLAMIDCNVPIDIDPQKLVVGEADEDEAIKFFTEVEIFSLADRFARKKAIIDTKYHLVDSEEALHNLIDAMLKTSAFAFDTETTSVDAMRAELVGLSFAWNEGEAYYIPLKGPDDMVEEVAPLNAERVLNSLKPVFDSPKIKKCGHNVKYDMLVLLQHGVPVSGLDFDTMIASYLLNPSLRQHNIDAVSMAFLNFKKVATSQLLGKGKKQIRMDQVPIEKVKDYACEDADIAWRLKGVMEKRLKEYDLLELFEKVEIPLVYVLMTMERNGVAIDEIYLARMSSELDQELKKLEEKIYQLAGGKFNINSPKQLATVLFEKLKLPTARKTKTGYSTDVTVLEELARSHELPRQILEYRQLAKLKSTYVDALPRLINPKTGRLHTSYNQTVAATGRLSSSDPNLQNIPIRTEIGKSIRRAFVPGDRNSVILDADYSQIELRIMAHLSQDETLKASFMNDEDVHRRTAALVFNVDPAEVTEDQRRKAKEVNFGIMYGMGAYGLSQRLGITPEEAEQFIQTYFANYPGVQQYMINIVQEAREKGYVTTLLNRRRYLPEILSDNRRMREFAERTAINTPIQGSAADLIKVAMIHIHDKLAEKKLKSMMIMQVHDELVFEVPRDEVETMKSLVRNEMENAIQLTVPIKVDIGIGQNWLDAH